MTEDKMLDEASAESFPASDPPASSSPSGGEDSAPAVPTREAAGRSPAGTGSTPGDGGSQTGPRSRPLVVGIGGSMSAESTSLTALEIALAAAEEAGIDTRLFSVRELRLPMFAPQGLADPPPAAVELAESAYEADGLLWSSPLYHGTISGSFKNALDWLQLLGRREPPFLTDKVVGLIAAAGGVQGLQAVNTMEFVVRALRAWAVPLVVPVSRAYQTLSEGVSGDPAVEQQLRRLGREVASVCIERRRLASSVALPG